MKTNICLNCKREFKIGYDRRRAYEYCSLACYYDHKSKFPPKHNLVCNWCKRTFHLKGSSVRQGMGKFCSKECYHLYLRGGKTETGETYTEKASIRSSSQYKSWRTQALKLHENKCDRCGVINKTKCNCCGNIIYLHVHHKIPFGFNVELRFDPTNSQVVCPNCHSDIENGANSGKLPTDNRTSSGQSRVEHLFIK